MAASEALSLGYGGVSRIRRASGLSRKALAKGIHEIKDGNPMSGRIRRSGAGRKSIVEGKIKPETYTADGVEHKTFSIKADYIRKIDYSAPSEASESKAAKPAKKAK